MADLMLESKANGTWEYEILEEKVKVKYPIKKGFNEIPGSHVETLEKDHGYKTKVKKGVYKVLKGGKALAASKADEKSLEGAKDVKKAEELYKSKVADLKKEHADQLKKEKDEYKSKVQELTELRAEALNQVKELEKEKIVLAGELASATGESKKELEILEGELADSKKAHDKQVSDLNISSEKKVKSLEGEKKALEDQVKKLKAK